MQGVEIILIPLLLAIAVLVGLTYGFGKIGGVTISSFARPRISTTIGVWVFLMMGVFIGVFAMLTMYTGEIGVVGLEWLFDNIHVYILVTAFVVAFAIPLGYLYIYRGGS